MEDLVPFLIFIVIALVNLVKFVVEKGGKKKPAPSQPGQAPAERTPSPLEKIFGELAQKLEPVPTPQPDWTPESYDEGPEEDYVPEFAAYEREVEPPPAPPAPVFQPPEPMVLPVQQKAVKGKKYLAPAQVASSAFASSGSVRLPTIPMMRRNSSGRINFELNNRKKLKQAILADLIFSPPRAYDCSFDNTMAK
jgi:hypothetical protein